MNKIPYVTREKAEEIAAQYPTPFYLYDEKGIRENAKAVKEAFAWNPGFREYFAVKATPNPYIMDIFRDYGFGFDCSSMTELMLSNAVGASGHEIMFSSNDTPAQEYAFAAKLGAIINLDEDCSEEEIGEGWLCYLHLGELLETKSKEKTTL